MPCSDETLSWSSSAETIWGIPSVCRWCCSSYPFCHAGNLHTRSIQTRWNIQRLHFPWTLWGGFSLLRISRRWMLSNYSDCHTPLQTHRIPPKNLSVFLPAALRWHLSSVGWTHPLAVGWLAWLPVPQIPWIRFESRHSISASPHWFRMRFALVCWCIRSLPVVCRHPIWLHQSDSLL